MKPIVYILIIALVCLNIIVLYFFIEGSYINKGFKTISRTDISKLLIIDLFAAITYIIIKSLKNRK